MFNDVFAALADPTRRYLFSQLARAGPSTATALAAELSISRQAVAKHLGVLSDAGMTTSQRTGRETRFTAHVEPLGDVQQWIAQVEGEWALRLEGLAATVKAATDSQA